MKRIGRILPHFTIILSGMFIVFWILDIINPTMNFINRKLSNKLLLVLLVSSIVTSVLEVFYERKCSRKKALRQEEEQKKMEYAGYSKGVPPQRTYTENGGYAPQYANYANISNADATTSSSSQIRNNVI